MVEAFDHGAHAVLAASIFHDGNMTVDDVKAELAKAGVSTRTFVS
jgi:cyclase/phosphoribosyl-ATP pyrophosphohydrolase/phosphoribosyl-AMP cyclohydrolase/histidinol dehydrogenase